MSTDTPPDEKPRLTDAEMLARFQNSTKRPPCTETLGARLVAVDQANMTCRFEFEASQPFANPTGAIQGASFAPCWTKR